jgi:undecaprenyl-diphosphatase
VLLGIVEGLTEFLPVSSTAHLRIAEALLGIDLGNGYWKMYTIVIQLGAILALPIYFRARIAKFLSTFPAGERGDRTALNHPLSLVMIAFVFTAAPSLLATKIIGKHLESIVLMGLALLIGGIVMWVVDAIYGNAQSYRTSHMEEMTLGQSVWIGACQTLSAIFPGTSRSMATIAAGQVAGMTRASSLEFSFFLSIPTMVAATGYDLLRSIRPKHGAPSLIGSFSMDAHGWVVLAIGFVLSFVVALGVVAWFMSWVRRRGFVPFAIYRIIFGIAVLAWALK